MKTGEICLQIENRPITGSIKSLKSITYFLGLYAFLSGFVFIEPSPAELFFILYLPFFIRTFKTRSGTVLISSLLFLPLFISTFVGTTFINVFNFRFVIIDVYLFLLFFLMSSLFSVRKLDSRETNYVYHTTMNFWTLAGVINVLFGLFAYVSNSSEIFGIKIITFGVRLTGFFKDPNVLGPYLIPAVAYSLYRVVVSKHKRVVFFILFVLLSLGTLLTFSRAAWLNYFITLILLLTNLVRNKRTRTKTVITSIILLSLILSVFRLGTDIEVFGNSLTTVVQTRAKLQSYDIDRFETQKAFVRILEEGSFLLGVGPGNYEVFTKYSTHSLFARYITERGFFGFSLFMIFLATFTNSLRKNTYSFILLPVLVGQFVNSLFIDSLHWRHLWLILAMCTIRTSVETKLKLRAFRVYAKDNGVKYY